MTEITQQYLKSILTYDPETGVFTWKERQDVQWPAQWNGRYPGKLAGSKQVYKHISYWRIEINRKIYRAHRLAWLYMTGEWPSQEIDHIDGNGLNNRFSNLRLASHSQNICNSRVRRDNKLGIRGVSRRGNRFRARIRISGKRIDLGYFDTPEEASVAYQKAAQEHFGEFARTE